MDRAEKTGLGIAFGGHVLLFAALSLGLLAAKPKRLPVADTMDVQFVDEVGLRSAAPTAAADTPAPSAAPEEGPPEEAPPAAPKATLRLPTSPSASPPRPSLLLSAGVPAAADRFNWARASLPGSCWMSLRTV